MGSNTEITEFNSFGHYLSMSRFVRTLSKIIFEPGELMVDSVKDIDKNKIAILLNETQIHAFTIELELFRWLVVEY